MAVRKTKAGSFEVDIRDQFGRKRLRTFATKREAREHEKKALGQISAGEFIVPSRATVREKAQEWYQKKCTESYRRATLVAWRNHVDNFIVPSLGDFKIQAVDVKLVEKVAGEWRRRVKPKTVNKVLTTLTAILEMAERHGVVQRNVAEKAERLK